MKKGLIFITILFFVFSLVTAANQQLIPTTEKIIKVGNSGESTRDILWQDDFEGGQDVWTSDGPWFNVETDAHSATHSWWTDDAIENVGSYSVDSPVISVPADWASVKVSYWYNSDLIDYEGDGDGYLDDYWEFYIMSPDDAIGWHQSTINAYEGGTSWYAGNDITGMYGTSAVYYMYTPEIDLTGAANAELTCMFEYDTEVPGGEDPPYDGWDVANIQISTDGWTTYEFLEDPANPYNVTLAYAGYINSNNPADTLSYPGWGGASADWLSGAFDLSAYAGNTVEIRFVLDSDPYTPAGGFWVDNIDVTVDGTVVLTDYDETVLLPDAGINNWERLDYDYNVTDGWVQSSLYDITTYSGKDVAFRINARIDDNQDGGDGGGFWFDDITIDGSNLPPYDGEALFTVVPYPTTAGAELHPQVVYTNSGLQNINPNLRVDVDGLGAPFDYLGSNPGEIATGEFGMGSTDALPTFLLEEGVYDWTGTVVVSSDADETNNSYTTAGIEVLPAGQYQLGYNSRIWDGSYITTSICGTYFTPFTDGILTDPIIVNTAQVMLLNNSETDNPTESITVKIWEAIDDVTPGTLIYEEDFDYTAGLSGEVSWAELTLTTPQTVNADFFVTIDGDFAIEGAVIVPVFDNMVRQYLGTGAYLMNTIYYDPDTELWGHSSGDRFINVLATDATGTEDLIPERSKLLGNYPNPFNPVTHINFQISEAGPVTLNIYNLKGELVKTLINETLVPNNYDMVWDGSDNYQNSVGSGVYFYKMKAGKYTSTKKMILMK